MNIKADVVRESGVEFESTLAGTDTKLILLEKYFSGNRGFLNVRAGAGNNVAVCTIEKICDNFIDFQADVDGIKIAVSGKEDILNFAQALRYIADKFEGLMQ